MFCIACGARLPEGARFCPACGAPVHAAPAAPATDPEAAEPAGAAAGPQSMEAGVTGVAAAASPATTDAVSQVATLPAPTGMDSGEAAGGGEGPRVYVTMPYEGASWHAGQTYAIQWAASGGADAPLQGFEIDLCGPDGAAPVRELAGPSAGLTGTARRFEWRVPDDLPGGAYRIRVRATNAAGQVGTGLSAGSFTIAGRAAPTPARVPTTTTAGTASGTAGLTQGTTAATLGATGSTTATSAAADHQASGAVRQLGSERPAPAPPAGGKSRLHWGAIAAAFITALVALFVINVILSITRWPIGTFFQFFLAIAAATAVYNYVKDM